MSQPAAFSEVALRVWGESAAAVMAPGRAASEVAEPSDLVVAPPLAAKTAPRPELRKKPQPGRASGLNEAQALAHDANNLLSALRLYGELLCFSGVLHERHRHYAEDLKLLSSRSESIIGRLITLAEQVSAEASLPPSSWPGAYPVAVFPDPASFDSARFSQARFNREEADAAEPSAILSGVLRRMKGLLGTIAQGPLEVDPGNDEEIRIAVPPDTLERIMVNLISNSAAAIRERGIIRIRTGVIHETGGYDRAGDRVNPGRLLDGGRNPLWDVGPGPNRKPVTRTAVLTVDDSGCGMSEAQVRAALGGNAGAIAEPSALSRPRLEPAPAGVPGLNAQGVNGPALGAAHRRRGMGLAIVRDLVAATGGVLDVQSREGVGTRIEIRWTASEIGRAPEVGYVAGVLTRPMQGAPQTTGTDLRSIRETGSEAGYAAAAKGAVA